MRRKIRLRKRTRKFDCCDFMPPLRLTTTTGVYNSRNSEVVNWLLDQESVRQWVVNMAKPHLVYNRDTQTWQGRSWLPAQTQGVQSCLTP